MINPRSLLVLRLAFSSLFMAGLAPVGLQAQTASTTAHVRLWKTELRGLNGVRVSFRPTGGRRPSPSDLGGGGPGYVFDNYADTLAGRGTLEVFAATDKHPLISLPADFTPGAFFTVLLRESAKPGAPPTLEVIPDSATSDDPSTAQITVRNFVEKLEDVKVTVGGGVNADFPTGKGFMQMQGLKLAVYPISTVGKGPDGKPFEWNTETDLKQHRHQTLLIYPDPYGRIRPRLCIDGENVTGGPDDKRSQR